MSAAEPERVGVLVIRIWLEAGSGPRARITATFDILNEVPTIVTASSVEEVCSIVREWLQDFPSN
jgi:hypothetical protein